MRDLAMFLAMFALLPLAFFNSFNAYLLWAWTTMLSPVFYMNGFMQSVRYNLIFAGITIGLLVLGKANLKGAIRSNSTNFLMFAFIIHVTFSAMFGYEGNLGNAAVYELFVKSLIFVLIMPVFVTTQLRLHSIIIVVGLALGFHGVVEGLKVVVTAGGHRVSGIPTTMMSDNNHFAVTMCMVIPLLVYLALTLQNRIARFAALSGVFLTLLSVVGTNSRGGFLCLAVLGIWYALTSRRKVLSLFVILALGMTIIFLAPDSWFQRIDTIRSAGEDSSFMGRVIAWKVSTAIAFANPIFGGGLHAVQSAVAWHQFIYQLDFLSFIYSPAPGLIPRAAHSIYFEILGDLGFVGLFLFLCIIVNAFLTARNIRKIVTGHPELYWARDLSDALKLALVAYCVGGAGVSLGYLDLFYIVAMLLEILRQHVISLISTDKNIERKLNSFDAKRTSLSGS